MLKSVKKIRSILWKIVVIGLFGISGLLLVPVVKYILKLVHHNPQVFGRIFIIIFALTCILGFLFTQNWNTRFAIICVGAAITINSLNINNRQ